jgi:hypothetical protein
MRNGRTGFDARLFVPDGHLTLVRGDDHHTFGPSGACGEPAGTLHEADGERWLAAQFLLRGVGGRIAAFDRGRARPIAHIAMA